MTKKQMSLEVFFLLISGFLNPIRPAKHYRYCRQSTIVASRRCWEDARLRFQSLFLGIPESTKIHIPMMRRSVCHPNPWCQKDSLVFCFNRCRATCSEVSLYPTSTRERVTFLPPDFFESHPNIAITASYNARL
jgi:hypothetical protein